MSLNIIDTLVQKNSGEFGIVDSNNIIGGFYQADTFEERDSIPLIRRKEGMFCWVGGNDRKVYQLVGGLENTNWIEFKPGNGEGGGTVIDGYAHIWIGTEPPKDPNMLWLDTNSDGILGDENDIETVNKLLTKVAELENLIARLTKRVEYLEQNGVKPPSTNNNIILLESGTSLLLENGEEILLESNNGSSNTP